MHLYCLCALLLLHLFHQHVKCETPSQPIEPPDHNSVPDPTQLPTAQKSSSPAPIPLLFIPSFHGSLLSHCPTPTTCTPIFLAPQTRYTFAAVKQHLLHSVLRPHPNTSADYPTASCAPAPFSRIAHCLPLPGLGPVNKLQKFLHEQDLSLDTLPYDWRLTSHQLFKGTFLTDLKAKSTNTRRTVLLAHGTGCPLVLRALSKQGREWVSGHVRGVVCAAPVWKGTAAVQDALSRGEGLLIAGGVYLESDTMKGAREAGRVDYRLVEFELGLKEGKRMSINEPDLGPWGVKDRFIISVEERISVARAIPSLQELGTAEESFRLGDGIGAPVVCIIAKVSDEMGGDGLVGLKEGTEGCNSIGRVFNINASHFDLVNLFGNIIESIRNGTLEM